MFRLEDGPPCPERTFKKSVEGDDLIGWLQYGRVCREVIDRE